VHVTSGTEVGREGIALALPLGGRRVHLRASWSSSLRLCRHGTSSLRCWRRSTRSDSRSPTGRTQAAATASTPRRSRQLRI
jgi:hypothetical protein